MSHTCENCQEPVVRTGTRGRVPALCPTCRVDPAVQRKRKLALAERRREAVSRRIDALMARLNALKGDQ